MFMSMNKSITVVAAASIVRVSKVCPIDESTSLNRPAENAHPPHVTRLTPQCPEAFSAAIKRALYTLEAHRLALSVRCGIGQVRPVRRSISLKRSVSYDRSNRSNTDNNQPIKQGAGGTRSLLGRRVEVAFAPANWSYEIQILLEPLAMEKRRSSCRNVFGNEHYPTARNGFLSGCA